MEKTANNRKITTLWVSAHLRHSHRRTGTQARTRTYKKQAHKRQYFYFTPLTHHPTLSLTLTCTDKRVCNVEGKKAKPVACLAIEVRVHRLQGVVGDTWLRQHGCSSLCFFSLSLSLGLNTLFLFLLSLSVTVSHLPYVCLTQVTGTAWSIEPPNDRQKRMLVTFTYPADTISGRFRLP